MTLPLELAKARDKIRQHAVDAGLDFFEVIFEIVDWNEMNAIAAYGGFPNRYPHWRFGMEYEQVSKSYEYGLSKIYEMVINNDPSYAYLLHSNGMVDQKLVMAHVYGHSDFFKNNVYFSGTNRKMIDEMGNHRSKVMRIVNRLGIEVVENFIDVCLSLENLIDGRAIGISPRKSSLAESQDQNPQNHQDYHQDDEYDVVKARELPVQVKKLPSKEYMDTFVNPKAFLEEQKKKLEEKRVSKYPAEPEKDILLFLIEHAPLERWEREILSIIREEAYYFAPQGQTKIMNEGWAAYHHSKIMTTKVLDDSEIIEYADHHSGTLATHPGRLNPYKLGIELFKDIEDRWNKGKFGLDYERCDDIKELKNWDKKLGKGQEKIFEVRKLYNDLTFLDAFLTEEFCHQHKLFMYGYNTATRAYEIVDRDFKKVKAKLLQRMTNMGQPQVAVVDANSNNRSELTLKHAYDGTDLRRDWAHETLKNLHRIWKRPVHIETMVDGNPRILSYEGEETKEKS